jgi:hypothetical protein
MRPRRPENMIDVHFPTDQLCKDFISRVNTFPKDTIRSVLERLLLPSTSLGIDPEPLERQASGNVLACCSQPDVNIILDG